jgi:site-specific recombinase
MLTAKSAKLIHELDPFTSLAILHAGFAGVFLFLSGLIAGNANNRSLVRRIPQRIAAHPGLRNIMAKGMRLRLAAWYERNFGGIISNLWFGIFMGSLGTVGMILGLPLDIRHITFAAGNFALGLVGNDWQIGLWPLIASILGIGIIGFINFIVSFTLSLALAMRSRGIPYSQLLPIARAVWRHHRKVPQAYYFPPAVVPEEPSGGRVEAGDLPDGDRTVARMREQDGKDGDGTTPQGP